MLCGVTIKQTDVNSYKSQDLLSETGRTEMRICSAQILQGESAGGRGRRGLLSRSSLLYCLNFYHVHVSPEKGQKTKTSPPPPETQASACIHLLATDLPDHPLLPKLLDNSRQLSHPVQKGSSFILPSCPAWQQLCLEAGCIQHRCCWISTAKKEHLEVEAKIFTKFSMSVSVGVKDSEDGRQ